MKPIGTKLFNLEFENRVNGTGVIQLKLPFATRFRVLRKGQLSIGMEFYRKHRSKEPYP